MKNRIMKKLNYLLLIFLALSIASCQKRVPKAPNDERQEKLHEDPTKVRLVLEEGTMTTEQFNTIPSVANFVGQTPQKKQTIIIVEDKKGRWSVDSSSPNKEFRVKSLLSEANKTYLLRVYYYNVRGEEMNYQFVENGQNSIHQHFFMSYRREPEDDKPAYYTKAELPYVYEYSDTNPHDDDAGVFIGKTDPLGFKGVFRFTQDNISFDMKLILVHSFNPKYKRIRQDGQTEYYPFYQMKPVRRDTDVDLPIRFVIGTGDTKLNIQ